jgi:hypothetical protein
MTGPFLKPEGIPDDLSDGGMIMEIFIWKALSTIFDRRGKQIASPRKVRSNRRVSRNDRRRAEDDGLVVTLSTREEKRQNPDRRQTADEHEQHFTLKV